MLFFSFPLHIYPCTIIVSVDESVKELHKHLKSLGIPDRFKEQDTVGTTIQLNANQILIRIISSQDIVNTIAHESFHAASFVLDTIGVKYKMGVSDECFAYLTGYITNEIYKNKFVD